MFRHSAVPVIALVLATACADTAPPGLAAGPSDPGAASGPAPVTPAGIAVTPAQPVEGAIATFECAVHPDPAATHAWDFGDGTTATGRQVDHVYAAPGAYRVVLTVNAGGTVLETTELDVVVVPAFADARTAR